MGPLRPFSSDLGCSFFSPGMLLPRAVLCDLGHQDVPGLSRAVSRVVQCSSYVPGLSWGVRGPSLIPFTHIFLAFLVEGDLYYISPRIIFWGDFNCGHPVMGRLTIFGRWLILYIIRDHFLRRFQLWPSHNGQTNLFWKVTHIIYHWELFFEEISTVAISQWTD